MPTTITSDRIVRQTKTTYAWTGTANASPSVQRIDGVVRRTNLTLNPMFSNGTGTSFENIGNGEFSRSVLVGAAPSGGNAMRLTAADANGDGLAAVGAGAWTSLVQPGTYLTSFWIRQNGAQVTAYAYREGNATTENVPYTAFVLPPNVWVLVSYRIVVTAAGTLKPGVLLNVASGVVVDYADFLTEQTNSLVPGQTFDGSTAGSTVITYASSSPLVVTGYEAIRQVRNVFSTVLGNQSTVATAFPAGLRSGNLTAVFGSRADALMLDGMLAGTDVLTYTDSDVPDAGMRFLPDGTIKVSPDTTAVTLDDGTTTYLWFVEFGYQEVTI